MIVRPLAFAAVILLAGCRQPTTRPSGLFDEGMRLRENEPVRAKRYLTESREMFFDLVQTGGLQDREKVGPLSYIARIYLEEKDAERTERHIAKGAEYVDPAGDYSGDPIGLSLIKGFYYERLAANTMCRIEAKHEDEATALRDRAVKELENGLVHYYRIRARTSDLYIERFVDLFKIRCFIAKGAIYEGWLRGGRRERLAQALANYQSAVEIVRRNAGMAFAFEKDFVIHQRNLEVKIELLTQELTK